MFIIYIYNCCDASKQNLLILLSFVDNTTENEVRDIIIADNDMKSIGIVHKHDGMKHSNIAHTHIVRSVCAFVPQHPIATHIAFELCMQQYNDCAIATTTAMAAVAIFVSSHELIRVHFTQTTA